MVALEGCWFGLVKDISGQSVDCSFHLDPGDTVILYTDGVVEAESAEGTLWEVEGFLASIKRHAHMSPEDMKTAILADVTEFMGTQLDDITMMILRRTED
jgi:sigma-B regulation protein RsbU (phosphoserine phosphatase)